MHTSKGAVDSNKHFRAKAMVTVGTAATLLSGCQGIQSALDPRGPAARALAETWWVLLIGATAIFLLVIALTLYAVLRAPAKRRPVGGHTLIVGGGVVLPVVALTALILYAADVSNRVRPAADNALRIEVIGHQWWWEAYYPDHGVLTANEIHVPAGRPVLIEVASADVIHSFWVPALAGKIDMLPEQRNRLWLQADEPGVYRGQCSEFCGAQHARMSKLVIALPPAEFETWLAAQQRPARAPTTPSQVRGREAFVELGCHMCHSIRGLGMPRRNDPAPDLTHVAGRRTLAAVTLENTPQNLRAWIRNSQDFKPGSHMPRFTDVEAATLDDVVAFLESLE